MEPEFTLKNVPPEFQKPPYWFPPPPVEEAPPSRPGSKASPRKKAAPPTPPEEEATAAAPPPPEEDDDDEGAVFGSAKVSAGAGYISAATALLDTLDFFPGLPACLGFRVLGYRV